MLFNNITLLDIFKKDGDENLSWAIIGVIMVFLFIPYGIYTNVRPYALLVVLYSFIMTLLKKPGAPFVVMAMALCVPFYLFKSEDYFLSEMTANKTQWVFLAVRLSVVLSVIYNIVLGRRILPFVGVAILSVLYALVLCLYGSTSDSIWKIINLLLYVHLFFAWCYYDRISFKSVYIILTAIFFCIFIYAILQYHLGITPYSEWYFTANWIEAYPHASGVCGNALVFAAVVLCYHSVLLLRFLKEGKINIFLLLTTFYAALISLERTAILVIAIVWIVFFAMRMDKIKENIIMLLIAGIIVFGVFSITFFDNTIDILAGRFQEGSGHRFAAYPMVLAAISDNIYGVGESGVRQAMQWYGSGELLRWFGTLDNFYLTQILYYGIFAIFPILFYLYYFIKAFPYRKTNKNLFHAVILCFLPWILIGFSFNINSFMQLSLLYFGLLGYIYTVSDMHKLPVIEKRVTP